MGNTQRKNQEVPRNIRISTVDYNFIEHIKHKNFCKYITEEEQLFKQIRNNEVIIYWIIFEVDENLQINPKILDYKGASGAYGLMKFSKKANKHIIFDNNRKIYIDYFVLDTQKEFLEIFYNKTGEASFNQNGILIANVNFNKNLFEKSLITIIKKYINSNYKKVCLSEHCSLIEYYIKTFTQQNMTLLFKARDLRENHYFLCVTNKHHCFNETNIVPNEDIRVYTPFPPYQRWLGVSYSQA